jgi:hypothetical protein
MKKLFFVCLFDFCGDSNTIREPIAVLDTYELAEQYLVRRKEIGDLEIIELDCDFEGDVDFKNSEFHVRYNYTYPIEKEYIPIAIFSDLSLAQNYNEGFEFNYYINTCYGLDNVVDYQLPVLSKKGYLYSIDMSDGTYRSDECEYYSVNQFYNLSAYSNYYWKIIIDLEPSCHEAFLKKTILDFKAKKG